MDSKTDKKTPKRMFELRNRVKIIFKMTTDITDACLKTKCVFSFQTDEYNK